MKPKHFVLPAVALAVAGILLGTQWKSVSKLRAENVELRERISVVRVPHSSPDASWPHQPDPHSEPVDWDKLAALFRENPASQPPGMLSIQRRLLAMEAAELLSALDHIAAMEIDEQTRMKLEHLILDPLCKKDPEAALERFKERLYVHGGIQTFLLSHALKDWARRDLAAATAWLDREIDAGTFEPRSLDGKDAIRTRFESAIIFGMFAANPAMAEARLSDLPADMRADVLRQADSFQSGKNRQSREQGEVAR